jgi:hypothetical protein
MNGFPIDTKVLFEFNLSLPPGESFLAIRDGKA